MVTKLLPRAVLEDPHAFLKKMIRFGMYLLLLLGVLMLLKYRHDEHEKELAEQAEMRQREAETAKAKEEVNWEERLKTIVPDQEDLLNPNVVPQLLLPPLHIKIDVPRALVYERRKQYSNAYEIRMTPSIRMWSATAVAAPLDASPSLRRDLPELSRPLSPEAGQPRAPKPFPRAGSGYILLP